MNLSHLVVRVGASVEGVSRSAACALLAGGVLVACAQGGNRPGDAGGGGLDAAPLDGAAALDGAIALDDGAAPDGGALTDAGPGADAGPAVDAGPSLGPTACTAGTAATVCGGRPCVDGYCCDSGCSATCRSCNQPGLQGTCTLHTTGEDPGNECAAEAAGTCGTTGQCDGAGACALHPDTTSCNDGEACTTGDSCDGAGTCRGVAPSACGPGVGNQCCVGTCSDAGGCETLAGSCPDVCAADRLTIGATCAGCGAAGAVGLCQGAGTHVCDATNHNLCQALTCGGVSYYCTNDGGAWAWRAMARCDDGVACTHTDTCGSGVCGGTPIDCSDTTCADRSCNGTATCAVVPNTGTSCEDGDLCTYNDTCNASGVCGAGPRATCTSSPCVDRVCNGSSTCTETVRTGLSCDDANPCTYGETCSGAGACGGASAISCDPMDTTCRDFSCNGTSTCASAPRALGGVCDDGNAATTSDVCQADGTCMGTDGCPPPTNSCTTGSQNRQGCANARIVGRVAASAAGGHTFDDSTCSANDSFDDSSGCFDAGGDHAYRLYMRAGESVTIRYRADWSCPSYSSSFWDATLKIFENAGCGDLSCGTKVFCEDFVSDDTVTYVAPRDGWIVILADGSSASEDEGEYRLTISLTCRHAGCEC